MVKVFSGYSEDMAINPNNLNKIFVAGQAMSGSKYIPAIHKTTDGGNNWTKRNLISKSGSAYSVTIDPVNNNIIYAGGGEWENYKSILYKSLNGGNDWTKIGGNITGYIYDIAVDPVSPSKVYAATSSGVYKSTNSGASWTKTSLSGSINCIKVYPKNPKIAGELINSFLSRHLPKIVLSRDLKELMKSYEDKHLEFKETLRYDIQRKTISRNVEKACLKTVCAFLNAEGGLLVIGISDDKRILGLSKDFQTLRHKDRDGFENHLMNQVSDKIGDGFLNFIKLDFHEIENKVICIAKVFPSDKPAYFKGERGQEFYVRVSNSSRPFSMSDATDYIKEHWR